jgi:hypothetical protein
VAPPAMYSTAHSFSSSCSSSKQSGALDQPAQTSVAVCAESAVPCPTGALPKTSTRR